MNVAVAGSIVLYDRFAKSLIKKKLNVWCELDQSVPKAVPFLQNYADLHHSSKVNLLEKPKANF